MTTYVALLRAVNVGGYGKLAMTDLVSLCEGLGFQKVRTYIASGNAVFQSDLDESGVKAALEAALLGFVGSPVPVMVRDRDAIEAVWRACPFHDAPGNRVTVTFLDDRPPLNADRHVTGQNDEVIALGEREIYTYYPSGLGASRLRIKAGERGTARNMNTMLRLVSMSMAVAR